MSVKLGETGRDVITGFEGVCLGTAQYLTGCNQALLAPRTLAPDGKRRDGEWFDQDRVQPLDNEVLVLPASGTGLDEPPPPTR